MVRVTQLESSRTTLDPSSLKPDKQRRGQRCSERWTLHHLATCSLQVKFSSSSTVGMNHPQQSTTQGQPGCSRGTGITSFRASAPHSMLCTLQVVEKCWLSRRMGKHIKERLAHLHHGHFQAAIRTQGIQIDLTSA